MRFNIHLRTGIKDRLNSLAEKMIEWENISRIDDKESKKISASIRTFKHTVSQKKLTIAGIDGSGDFPAVAYGDSFVYTVLAQGVVYKSTNHIHGLKEIGPEQAPVLEFVWLPEEDNIRRDAIDNAFSVLAGENLETVIKKSDYRFLKPQKQPVDNLVEGLIRPHAADSGNLAIQFRSTAEFGAALRLIKSDHPIDFFLMDTTMSLPFIGRKDDSLFYEHLKRYCCVEALKKRIGFFALSKSHGLPSMELIEDIIREKLGLGKGEQAEHWFIRLPVNHIDDWDMSIVGKRNIPPIGAISYLIRFHHTTPVLRLDMDRNYWETHVFGKTDKETYRNECHIFESLDYASHDQRCYGYPYPIKAGHDRASLTKSERIALRKQIIDAAVSAGMNRALFRSTSIATGHE